jgi:hypothetical protein
LPEHAVVMGTGVQPQTFGVPPPPQVCGALHVPQLNAPPHPLGAVPQVWEPHTDDGGSGVHVTVTVNVASAAASPTMVPSPLTEFPHALKVTVPTRLAGGVQLTSNVTWPSVTPSSPSSLRVACVASDRPPAPGRIWTSVPAGVGVVASVPLALIARLKPAAEPLVVLMVTRKMPAWPVPRVVGPVRPTAGVAPETWQLLQPVGPNESVVMPPTLASAGDASGNASTSTIRTRHERIVRPELYER